MKPLATICTVWFLVAGSGMLGAQTSAQAEKLLESARHKEVVDGDLKAASEQYRKIAGQYAKQPEVAARALYQLGQCQEKLGQAEARKSYERIVRDYAGAQQYASAARARLAALGGPGEAGSVRTRLVWDNAPDVWGKTSTDGRYFSFTDWSSCDVGLRDLLTGESRKVTKFGGCFKAHGEVWGTAVSPDGKRIAFGYFRYGDLRGADPDRKDGRMDLRVIAADGTGEKTLMHGGGLDYADPQSWSPDGRWIAAAVSFRNASVEEWAIALVSVESGQFRRLRVKRQPAHPAFSPDGKWLAYSIGARGASPTLLMRAVEGEAAEQTVLENAVMMGWTPDGTALLFSRGRGGAHDLYLIPVSEGAAVGAPTPIYSSADVGTMPAGVTRQGSLLFRTFNSRAESQVLPWTGEGVPQSTPLFSMPATTSVAWLVQDQAAHFSHDGKRLLVVNPHNGITIRDMASGGERTIAPQLKSWRRARWAHDDAALLLSGTDTNGRTGVYRVDDAAGKAELLTELPQTSSFAPSRDGKTIYYRTATKTQARDLATGQDKTLFESPGGGSHDLRLSRDGNRLAIRSWAYLAVVDLRSGQGREIYRVPQNTHTAIWAMDWSADDRQIVTIVRPGTGVDKMECWIFSPDGGEPKRRANPADQRGLSLSPDAKYVATTSLTQRGQVWALENFLPGKN